VKVGVPRERTVDEYRVALTPAGVREFCSVGHTVFIESGAGRGCGIGNDEYRDAGAKVIDEAANVWGEAELIMKVKEPNEAELSLLRRGQILFTYLHLAASRECTLALVAGGVTAIAYETVEMPDGSLPLLAPMSEVAGRMAPQVGAHCLQREGGGRGVLMGGVPGVEPAKVVVLGAGVAGRNAAAIAVGMRANVTVIDCDLWKLRELDRGYEGRVRTRAANSSAIVDACLEADLVIGAVLVTGARAPRLVSHDVVKAMRPGAVLVDIAVDQGGCMEDTRPTTHSSPTFTVGTSVMYCVANMPGAVPNTSTHALTNATLAYALAIASHGWREACRRLPPLLRGLNTFDGVVTHRGVAAAHSLDFVTAEEFLG
jgi:alanine dehydrogenase